MLVFLALYPGDLPRLRDLDRTPTLNEQAAMQKQAEAEHVRAWNREWQAFLFLASLAVTLARYRFHLMHRRPIG